MKNVLVTIGLSKTENTVIQPHKNLGNYFDRFLQKIQNVCQKNVWNFP